MTLRKNVASQKVGFVMVDKTDFATPETGISPSGVIRKDGGASAALTNTVSELTNGYYVVTLTNSETNADMLQLRFHDSAASCATQFIVLYPDQAMTYASDVLSTLDDVVGSQIASILIDTSSTLGKATSILADTTSILADTITLSNATYGLDALETLCSDIKDQAASILADTQTLSNATYGLDALETLCSQILTDTGTTLENRQSSIFDKVSSILTDTGTTLENRTTSIVDYVSQIESNVSNIHSTIDDFVGSQLASILADTGDIQDNWTAVVSDISSIDSIVANLGGDSDKITSILADTKTLSNATYGLDALETLCSQILTDTGTTLDNRQQSILADTASILVDTKTTLDDKIDSILVDTKTTLDDKLDSILVDTGSTLQNGQTSIIGYTDGIETILTGASFRKNVALNNFTFVLKNDDHYSMETGASVTGTISQNGGAFGALTNAVSEIGNGCYKVNLTQAEMNTDVIILRFTATGADDTLCFIHTID